MDNDCTFQEVTRFVDLIVPAGMHSWLGYNQRMYLRRSAWGLDEEWRWPLHAHYTVPLRSDTTIRIPLRSTVLWR